MAAKDAKAVAERVLAISRANHQTIGKREGLSQKSGSTSSRIRKMSLIADRVFGHARNLCCHDIITADGVAVEPNR